MFFNVFLETAYHISYAFSYVHLTNVAEEILVYKLSLYKYHIHYKKI